MNNKNIQKNKQSKIMTKTWRQPTPQGSVFVMIFDCFILNVFCYSFLSFLHKIIHKNMQKSTQKRRFINQNFTNCNQTNILFDIHSSIINHKSTTKQLSQHFCNNHPSIHNQHFQQRNSFALHDFLLICAFSYALYDFTFMNIFEQF
jgi:hypothetical protein